MLSLLTLLGLSCVGICNETKCFECGPDFGLKLTIRQMKLPQLQQQRAQVALILDKSRARPWS